MKIPKSFIKKNIVTIIIAILGVLGLSSYSNYVEQAEPYLESAVDSYIKEDTLEDISGIWKVIRVSDGDTIVVNDGTKEEKIRLLGIDTPELSGERNEVECFANEAKIALAALVENQNVTLESDSKQDFRDKYGRILAYVYNEDGYLVNEKMIEEGFAYELTVGSPHTKAEAFKDLEISARMQGKGLWGEGACF